MSIHCDAALLVRRLLFILFPFTRGAIVFDVLFPSEIGVDSAARLKLVCTKFIFMWKRRRI